MEIPPPITEENKDRYLEELSKIKESEDWIERHSIENKSNQEELSKIKESEDWIERHSIENKSNHDANKTEQHRNAKTSPKEVHSGLYYFVIDTCVFLLFVFGPLLFIPFL